MKFSEISGVLFLCESVFRLMFCFVFFRFPIKVKVSLKLNSTCHIQAYLQIFGQFLWYGTLSIHSRLLYVGEDSCPCSWAKLQNTGPVIYILYHCITIMPIVICFVLLKPPTPAVIEVDQSGPELHPEIAPLCQC